ncbi:alpha/beta fold hydrolase [Psychromonas aquimarina]|uniref:alpha/beta fold hydrolase n=1 Tax=Psychromonas aquimarina TaxID=444919 RepID=UPI00040123CE|nr:alpha/beta fold hydrolase [Psychromonas aquimarina]
MHRSIIVAALTALLFGCNSSDSNTNTFSSTLSPTVVNSSDCPANMQCGLLPVPKSYTDNNGETIDIYYAVHKALDSDNRIGILVLNFGGPGGESVNSTSSMVQNYLPQEILERFDIVGIDPRGTGKSAYSQALTDCAVAQSIGTGNCDAVYTATAPYLGSNSIVKDIDQLRSFLGEEKLNFLGYSYGTRLGSLYANIFPENVRAIVLDSPMPPATGNYVDLQLGNTAGNDLVADYRLGFDSTRKLQYENIITTTFNNIYYHASDGFALSIPDAVSTLYLTVSREHSGYWQAIQSGLFDLLDNDYVSLLNWQLASIGTSEDDADSLRSQALFKAVVCTDESQPLSRDDIVATQSSFESTSTLYGLVSYYSSFLCADWSDQRDPIAAVENMEHVLAGQQILIIGGKYDPATPYQWTEEMVNSFGNSASLITVDQLVSHAFSYTDISCVDAKATQYLLDPDTKIENTSCSGTPQNQTFMRALSKPVHPARKNPQGTY